MSREIKFRAWDNETKDLRCMREKLRRETNE